MVLLSGEFDFLYITWFKINDGKELCHPADSVPLWPSETEKNPL